MVFPPQNQNTAADNWSAKERGVFEGGKTSANLAAIFPVFSPKKRGKLFGTWRVLERRSQRKSRLKGGCMFAVPKFGNL